MIFWYSHNATFRIHESKFLYGCPRQLSGIKLPETPYLALVASDIQVQCLIWFFSNAKQALIKSNRTEERVSDYVIVEETTIGWDNKVDTDRPRTQRLLDLNEYILHAQDKWKGRGKFTLKRKGNVSM